MRRVRSIVVTPEAQLRMCFSSVDATSSTGGQRTSVNKGNLYDPSGGGFGSTSRHNPRASSARWGKTSSDALVNPRSTASPYATALKHVALRGGRGALGPSAKEAELAMYNAQALPADYRPPVQGKWDDTVERWAYAWQFPAEEDAELTEKDERIEIATTPAFLLPLVEIAEEVRRDPTVLKAVTALHVPSAVPSSRIIPPPSLQSSEDAFGGSDEDAFFAALSSSTVDAAQAPEEVVSAALVAANDNPAALFLHQVPLYEMPGSVPQAYIFNPQKPGLSSLAMRLGKVLMGVLNLSFNREGVTTALYALAYAATNHEEIALPSGEVVVTDTSHVRSLFNLAHELGFLEVVDTSVNSINAVERRLENARLNTSVAAAFNALMYPASQSGQPSDCMAIIEEMKAAGVTPVRESWHLLMVAFHKARDYNAVIQVADNMKAYANLEPDETTFALQLSALAADRSRDSNIAEAVQLFDTMENVYGYVASRPHYHALMSALSSRSAVSNREHLELLGTRMELIGIPWNTTTFNIQLKMAQQFGDIVSVRKLFAKARNESITPTAAMYAQGLSAYSHFMARTNFQQEYTEKGASPVPFLQQQVDTARALYRLLQSRQERDDATTAQIEAAIAKGEASGVDVSGLYKLLDERTETLRPHVTDAVTTALLRVVVDATILAMEHAPDDVEAQCQFDQLAATIWESYYPRSPMEDASDEAKLLRALGQAPDEKLVAKRSKQAHGEYIRLLAHQQRRDEAEALFQDLVLVKDEVPLPRTYVSLMMMHLSSGEEGGTARALQYMEAMERNKMHISSRLVHMFVRVNNEAGYKRDMKRRARRIIQAREEYMARQAEKSAGSSHPTGAGGGSPTEGQKSALNPVTASTPSEVAVTSPVVPTELFEPKAPVTSRLEWWDAWKRESLSKHALFDGEGEDGMPKGGTDGERRIALSAMGIVPLDKEEMPNPVTHRLLPTLREREGQTAGALWGMDGGELSYPKDGNGPDSWGVQLWRERRLLQAEHQKALDGYADLPELSSIGNSVRLTTDQLAIQDSGAKTPGELSDYLRFPDQRYDDGTLKPASEAMPRKGMQTTIGSELVWRQELSDPISVYKNNDEIALENEGSFFADLELKSASKVQDSIAIIQNKAEGLTDVIGETSIRKGANKKYDYLERWREMYAHGSLEAPDEPLVHFGRSPDDHKKTLSNTIKGWYAKRRNQRGAATSNLPTAAQAEQQETQRRRDATQRESTANKAAADRRRQFRPPPSA